MDTRSRQAAASAAFRRRLFGMAGVMVGSVGLVGLTLLFNQASQMPWLAPTEANAALIARCDGIASAHDRRRCVEAVVAAVRARGAEPKLAINQQAASSAVR